eukprot:TRINITY_DN1416_c0_g2_i1.p1 TRINITY_DN1416_c0_g2~~TRINITY_DN1416_c0_g2_i1.p1  ORF type:complete len:303 (-),score=35.94 TRINITY_DN1416_c0_g2_i1:159-1067(-)
MSLSDQNEPLSPVASKTVVKSRRAIEKSTMERKKWNNWEDDTLISLIKKYGTKNWRLVAAKLSTQRTAKQCRERWINHLDPDIIKGKLTKEEWNIVVAGQEELGNRWSDIAKLLPGRTPNQIKNVWHAMMRRETKIRKPKKRKLSDLSDGEGDDGPDSSESDEQSDLSDMLEVVSTPKQEQSQISRLDALVEIVVSIYEQECCNSETYLESNNNNDMVDEIQQNHYPSCNMSDDYEYYQTPSTMLGNDIHHHHHPLSHMPLQPLMVYENNNSMGVSHRNFEINKRRLLCYDELDPNHLELTI